MKSFLAYISLVLCLFIIPQNYSTAGPVTIASWGGAYTESQKKGPANYASKKTGIKHKFVDYSGGLSQLKLQKKSGKIKWDIMDVYARDTIVGCDEGLFVEFDFNVFFKTYREFVFLFLFNDVSV